MVIENCPCCGAKAELGDYDENEKDFGGPVFFIVCSECELSTKWYDKYQDAIDAWNKRFRPTDHSLLDHLRYEALNGSDGTYQP